MVEFGCGDWATSRLINFGQQREYLGLDIVQTVIEQNRKTFAAPGISFAQCDFLSDPTSTGDLLLIKDVLQHLSNRGVQAFIKNILPRFRYAIMTNDVRKYEEWRRFGVFTATRELQELNIDISDGSSRPLRLDAAPFGLEVTERSTYSVLLRTKPRRVTFIKDILVWRNSHPLFDKTIA